MAWRNLDLIFLKVSPISYRGGNVLRYGSVSWDNIQPPLSYLPHLDHCRLKRRLPQKVSDILGHMCWNMDGTWWHYLIHQDKSCSVMSMLQHVTKYSNILQHDETCHHLCNHLLNTRGIHDGIWPRQSFKLALAVSDSIQRVNHTYTYANPSLHFLGPYHTMPYHTLNFLEIVIHSKSYKRHLK